MPNKLQMSVELRGDLDKLDDGCVFVGVGVVNTLKP